MDLSKLSTEDLLALRQGNLSAVSTAGLMSLKQLAAPKEPALNPASVSGSLRIGPFDTGYEMSPGWTNALAGAGKAVVDAGRGLGQVVGAVSRDDVAESRRRDKPLMDTGAGLTGNILGNVAMALTPGVALKGLSSVPAAARFAPALSGAGQTLMAPSTIGAGLAVGAGMGAIQPSESTSETVLNTLGGSLAGGLVPAAMTAGRTAKAFAEPFYESGRRNILGRALVDGSGVDAQTLTDALKTGFRPLVPGSLPTTAQASGLAPLAALERSASGVNPSVMKAFTDRTTAQNAARFDALGQIAGTPTTLKTAKDARGAATQALYDQTNGTMVKVDDALESLLRRPSIAAAMRDAAKLADDSGVRVSFDSVAPTWQQAGGMFGATKQPERYMSGEALHFLKMALDDAANPMTAPIRGIGDKQLKAIQNNKSAFLGWMEDRVPEYRQARTTYAQMSQPVNAQQVAQEIREAATNSASRTSPTGMTMSPAAYNRAFSDDTAKAATGMSNATLESVFDPAQYQTMRNIGLDIGRTNFSNTGGRGAGSDTVQRLAFTNILNQAGVPTFLRNFSPTQAVGNVLAQGSQVAYSRANRELSESLAQALLDPKRARALVLRLQNSNQPGLAEVLRLGATPAALSLPGIVNAQ